MVRYPADLLVKLEFDKVLELLSKKALSEITSEYILNIRPSKNLKAIQLTLNQVADFKLSLDQDDDPPLQQFDNVLPNLDHLRVEGYVLPQEQILHIWKQLLLIRKVLQYFNSQRKQSYPHLFQLFEDINLEKSVIAAFEKVFDEEGKIRDDASDELLAISRQQKAKHAILDKKFNQIASEYKAKNYLESAIESIRNGRRVLSVKAENKRKIKGIIHDESATGQTIFIEPEAIVEINNDILNLESAYRREVYQILRVLCAILRPIVPQIHEYQEALLQLDLIRAKARLAMDMNADKPTVIQSPSVDIKKGYHPLLWLKNKAEKKQTVPFSLFLNNKTRILLISGPNAGGKSIAMKAIGLMQLMVQSGMMVPAQPDSQFGIFEKVFADIGDQQSLEDDLSTYSSRLKHMETFVREANKQSLVLIDEFGSGTDPKMGGAIAEAILKRLNQKKVFGVITTHYSNLKIFAFKEFGIVNGAMLFDREKLSPTYKLKIGKPGSSFAFEIAAKSGLEQKILQYAKHKAGKQNKAIEELLVELQSERKELEEKIDELKGNERKLELLIKNYERMQLELSLQRKKMRLEKKEMAMVQASEENRELQKVVREITEAQNIRKAKELAEQARHEKEKLTEQVSDLKEEIYYKDIVEEKIVVDDFVKLRAGGAKGRVLSINNGVADVEMGFMNMQINLRDLELTKEPLDIKSTKSVHTNMNQYAEFSGELDIRGMRRDLAIQAVEEFVDKAIINSMDYLKIIHGKGNGVLKNAVREKLKEYRDIEKVSHPIPEEGGDGVTLISM